MTVKIKLDRRSKTTLIKLNKQTHTVRLVKKQKQIKLNRIGGSGPPGDRGEPGPGLPPGGTTDQIIQKASNDDYDFKYADANDLADKNYIQDFVISSTVNVVHNLGKLPAVTVITSAGDEVECEVTQIDLNSLTVVFNAPFSGKIICN